MRKSLAAIAATLCVTWTTHAGVEPIEIEIDTTNPTGIAVQTIAPMAVNTAALQTEVVPHNPIHVVMPDPTLIGVEIDTRAMLETVNAAINAELIEAEAVVAQMSLGEVAPFSGDSFFAVTHGPNEPLLLRSGGRSDTQINEIVADMSVMTRIFHERIADASRGKWAIGDGIHRIYLGDDGVAFLFGAPFPLVGSDASGSPEANSDEVWQRALRDLWGTDLRTNPGQTYDAKKVESLQTGIKSALIHAKNIRHLDADDSVTVIVYGEGADVSTIQLMQEFGAQTQAASPRAIMTIRASMSGLGDPSVRIDTAGKSEALEDVAVMSRVLHNTLTGELGDLYGSQDRFWVTNGSVGMRNGAQGLYIDGYGALFLANVRFSVFGVPESGGPDSTDTGDAVWERARREATGVGQRNSGFGWSPDQPADESSSYDAELVNSLTHAVAQSLKYAARIRGVDADEAIVVAVRGPSGRLSTLGGGVVVSRSQDSGGYAVRFGSNDSGRTLITYRASKRDVDRYAAGELNLDEFKAVIETQSNFSVTSRDGRGVSYSNGIEAYPSSVQPTPARIVPSR